MFNIDKTILWNIFRNILHPYRLACGIACGIGMSYNNKNDIILGTLSSINYCYIYALFLIFGFFIADILSTLCGSEPERKKNLLIIGVFLFISAISVFIFIHFNMLFFAYFFVIISVISLFLFIMSLCDPNSITIFSSTYGHYEIED